MSTYFIGATGVGVDSALLTLADPENKADIHYLGSSGLTVVKQLSIAFLDRGTVRSLHRAWIECTSADQSLIDLKQPTG